jgi:hypothetical protein
MDVHIPRPITVQLRLLGTDVVTAQEDGRAEVDNATLLDRAAELRRVLFTQDKGLLAEASRRQRGGIPFGGLIYSHALQTYIGRTVSDLRLIAEASEPDEWVNRVEYLPL